MHSIQRKRPSCLGRYMCFSYFQRISRKYFALDVFLAFIDDIVVA